MRAGGDWAGGSGSGEHREGGFWLLLGEGHALTDVHRCPLAAVCRGLVWGRCPGQR